MTPKERVIKAIDLELGDRVPLDFHATPEMVDKLKVYFRVENYEDLLIKLGVDIRGVHPEYVGPELRRYPDGTWEDFYGIRFKRVDYGSGSYNEVAHYVLDDINDPAEVDKHNWPNPEHFDFSSIREQCERYGEYTIVYGGAGVFQRIIWLRRMENVLLDMAIRPEIAKRLFKNLTDFHVELYDRALGSGEGKIDILAVSDDFGTQNGLLMSPDMWREFIAPNLKKLIDVAHSHGSRYMQHSCGGIKEIIPDLIELGVDIIDPVQTSARGMDPEVLKADFGDRICFHGSVDVQTILPFGTVDDVRAEVNRMINTLGRNGGLILGPSHAIQPDTPAENVAAMYESALQI
jgi:uroporphyrinogen decarboxylase